MRLNSNKHQNFVWESLFLPKTCMHPIWLWCKRYCQKAMFFSILKVNFMYCIDQKLRILSEIAKWMYSESYYSWQEFPAETIANSPTDEEHPWAEPRPRTATNRKQLQYWPRSLQLLCELAHIAHWHFSWVKNVLSLEQIM